MRRYTLCEIAGFAAVSAVLFAFFPDSSGSVYASIVVTYLLLQVVSALAFCIAIHKGLVHEHAPAPYRYSVEPACRDDWLVMRHIWSYLRGA